DLYYPEYYASYYNPVAPDWYYDTTVRLPEEYAPPMPPADGRAAPADTSVHLTVRVPAGADILVDGVETRQTGPVRQFVSPPLSAGNEYMYEITARWTVPNGRDVV